MYKNRTNYFTMRIFSNINFFLYIAGFLDPPQTRKKICAYNFIRNTMRELFVVFYNSYLAQEISKLNIKRATQNKKRQREAVYAVSDRSYFCETLFYSLQHKGLQCTHISSLQYYMLQFRSTTFVPLHIGQRVPESTKYRQKNKYTHRHRRSVVTMHLRFQFIMNFGKFQTVICCCCTQTIPLRQLAKPTPPLCNTERHVFFATVWHCNLSYERGIKGGATNRSSYR